MRYLLLTVEILFSLASGAQDAADWEQLQSARDRSIETENLQQELTWRTRQPLSLNGDLSWLAQAGLIAPQQLQSLYDYRKALGALVAVEELAAVPFWDAATIARVQPFVTAGAVPAVPLLRQWRGGEHRVVLRWGRSSPSGDEDKWTGAADRLFVRYRYRHSGGLRWGITAEKDPGEKIWDKGPDFCSAYISGPGRGWLKQWIVGDYDVQLGQGLALWQGLAFGTGADLTLLKRQAPVLQPHTSAVENGLYRGGALGFGRAGWTLDMWASHRALDAGIGVDSVGKPAAVRSIRTSGYHRTAGEREGREGVRQTAWGGQLRWERSGRSIGLYIAGENYSLPFERGKAPYQALDGEGCRYINIGADWSVTWRGWHTWGEWSVGGGRHALVSGVLFSAGTRWDAGLLYRHYAAGFPPRTSGAPARWDGSGESGLYFGLRIRPATATELSLWADAARSLWLRYGVDGTPESFRCGGALRWRPHRELVASAAWRYASEAEWQPYGPVKIPVARHRQAVRVTVDDGRHPRLQLSLRGDAVWQEGSGGFAGGGGMRYRTIKWGSVSLRAFLVETDGYDDRIYTSEADGTGGAAVLPVWGKGMRYSFLYQYPFSKKISWSLMATFFRPRPVPKGETEGADRHWNVKSQLAIVL